MFKFTSSASVLMLSLMAGSAFSSELVIALPDTYPGDIPELKTQMWDVFLSGVGPGTTYRVINGTTGRQAARIKVPDDEKYNRVKWRIKKFARQNAGIGGLLKHYQAGSGSAQIDVPTILRNLGDNRLDINTEIDLLIVGNPVHLTNKDELQFSMRNAEGQFFVPSQAHIRGASLAQTPYGTAGRETGLKNVFVHFCVVNTDDDWNSAYSEALHRFWSLSSKQQDGKLVTWTDDIKACFERFQAKARNAAKSFSFQKDDIGLAMIKVSRTPVSTLERGTKAIKDIAIDEFNVFADLPHPTMSSVKVMTGIKYQAEDYPAKFETSWCYFNHYVAGATVRVSIGTMSFGQPPVWAKPSPRTLKAANLSMANVTAAQGACQFPAS